MEEDRITFYIPEVHYDHVASGGLNRVLDYSIGGSEDGKLSAKSTIFSALQRPDNWVRLSNS